MMTIRKIIVILMMIIRKIITVIVIMMMAMTLRRKRNGYITQVQYGRIMIRAMISVTIGEIIRIAMKK